MKDSDLQRLNDSIRNVLDFPKPGIVFKDITPVLGDGELFRLSIDGFLDSVEGQTVTKIIGIDARGFIFGAAVADRLGVGFVPIRKKGKLPWNTEEIAYALEYGEAEVEVHCDSIAPGEKVMLVDDLLATGGTAGAALALVKKLGGDVVSATFLIELEFLKGRHNLPSDVPVHALLTY